MGNELYIYDNYSGMNLVAIVSGKDSTDMKYKARGIKKYQHRRYGHTESFDTSWVITDKTERY